MPNECQVIEKPETALQVQGDSFMSVIERLASRPDIDPTKIKQFMDMQERILDRNAKQAFNAAMMRAQAKIPTILKDKPNQQTNSKYAALESILKIIKPLYTAEGFSLMFYEGDTPKEKHIRVCVDIMHEQGHTEKRFVDMAIDDVGIKGSPNKTIPHAEGSSFLYGRRYLTCLIFNVPTGDDDDGNGAGGVEYITEKQLSQLTDMINDTETKEDKFMSFMKVESLDKIPAKQFGKAFAALQAKMKKGSAK